MESENKKEPESEPDEDDSVMVVIKKYKRLQQEHQAKKDELHRVITENKQMFAAKKKAEGENERLRKQLHDSQLL